MGFDMQISMCMQQMAQGKIRFRKHDLQISLRLPGKKKKKKNAQMEKYSPSKACSYVKQAYPNGFQVTGTVKLKSNEAHVATPNGDILSGPGY